MDAKKLKYIGKWLCVRGVHNLVDLKNMRIYTRHGGDFENILVDGDLLFPIFEGDEKPSVAIDAPSENWEDDLTEYVKACKEKSFTAYDDDIDATDWDSRNQFIHQGSAVLTIIKQENIVRVGQVWDFEDSEKNKWIDDIGYTKCVPLLDLTDKEGGLENIKLILEVNNIKTRLENDALYNYSEHEDENMRYNLLVDKDTAYFNACNDVGNTFKTQPLANWQSLKNEELYALLYTFIVGYKTPFMFVG
jgi:hypothetical protein